ncbi:MAG: PQQ-binding-like beta-propeller repeat protein, partial [Verrucomicrobiales bacterium]
MRWRSCLLIVFVGSALLDAAHADKADRAAQRSCGIADLDKIRTEVAAGPTGSSNVLSRRAAFYRWWRLLWHQGYDMNMNGYAAVWEKVLSSSGEMAYRALDDAYAALEDISAKRVIIEEVGGSLQGSGVVSRTDWPGYHGTDGGQTGYSPDAGPSAGKVAWRIAKGNFWYAAPVIEDGRVYTASPGADVIAYCLDEATGKVIWNGRQFGTQVYTTPGSIFSPVVSARNVLVTTGWWQPDKHFILDRESGLTEAQLAAATVAGGQAVQFTVYKHNRWNVILADAVTGKGIWTFRSGGNLSGEPVLDGEEIYAARQSGRVFRFGADSNRPLWQRDLQVQLRGTPGIGSRHLYVGDRQRGLHALASADGRTEWTFRVPESEFEPRAYQFFSTPVEARVSSSPEHGRVYVGTAGGYLYCLEASSGRLIWKHKLSDWVRSRPVVVDDIVYVATLDAKLVALRDAGATAQELWQTQLGEHGFTA